MKCRKRFICIFFLFLLFGCTTQNHDVLFGLECPNALYVNDNVYWESRTVSNMNGVEYVGKVKLVAKEQYLPSTFLEVSASLKELKGQNVYKKDHIFYIKENDMYREFVYYDTMELEKEELLKENAESNEENITYAVKPHFVNDGMLYFIHGSLYTPSEEDLKSFTKVGSIKKVVHRAQFDETGNLTEGDTLYKSEYQNRYMIVQYTSTNQYEVYENYAYTEEYKQLSNRG